MKRRFAPAIIALGLAAAALPAQLPVNAGVSMSLTEHRVTAGAGLERSSGTMFGIWASTTLPWQTLEARAALRAGSLGATEAPAMDRDVGELSAGVVLPLNAWVGLNGGLVVRRYESALAAQRWVWGELGLDARMSMLENALDLSAGLAIIPWVSVSGISRPDLAVAARSMIAYRTGRLTATMRYSLERFDFAARQQVRRLEELSSLELGVAWRVR